MKLGYILGFIIEYFTIRYSASIKKISIIDYEIELAKRGYKISRMDLDRIINELEKEKKFFKIKKFIQGLFLYIPFINILFAITNKNINKNYIVNSILKREHLISMSDKEKEGFNKMTNFIEKYAFIEYICDEKNKNMELLEVKDGSILFYDRENTFIDNERLLPLAYTIDEVRKLNKVTNCSYRIGKIDDVNVAIIGIPNDIKNIDKVKFIDDDYESTHTYESMSDEEARNKTFIVYPFTNNNIDDIKKVIEDIKEYRNNRLKSKRIQLQYANNNYINKEQGYVLKKTLKRGK